MRKERHSLESQGPESGHGKIKRVPPWRSPSPPLATQRIVSTGFDISSPQNLKAKTLSQVLFLYCQKPFCFFFFLIFCTILSKPSQRMDWQLLFVDVLNLREGTPTREPQGYCAQKAKIVQCW
jgi:hypothetical protein